MEFKNIDLHGVYVALSRVRELDGLNIKGVDWDKIRVNPDVVNFYKSLDED